MCGDFARDDGEQCDDGNLSNGDGCSNICTLESCGNGTVDAIEQCDDGNTAKGDGCSDICRIEFCGDTEVQSGINEQCDDGNRLSGDGCSSLCKSENQAASSSSSEESQASESSASESSAASSGDEHSAAPDETSLEPDISTPIASQATEAAKFFLSPESEEYKAYVTQTEQDQLLQIMHKIESHESLTEQEKVWARELLAVLTAARDAERARYTDLLKQFIATPISADVVNEKNLTEQRLIDVAVPIAVEELQQAISIIERGELQSRVLADLALLQRQGLDLASELPPDFASSLAQDARSINVFETLKTIKESAEKYATPNLPASLEVVHFQVGILRGALPVLEREYGLNQDTVLQLLDDIDTVSGQVTKQDTQRLLIAVNTFLTLLEKEGIVTRADLSVDIAASHAAAHALLLPADANLELLIDSAPVDLREIFGRGTLEEQKGSLLAFLDGNDRVHAIIASLPAEQKQNLQVRFSTLEEQINRIGVSASDDTACDDSLPNALVCTAQFLSDTQTAARERSPLSNLIGKLQDYFGIGL